MPNLYVALTHYPVVNKRNEIIASALTNLDLHYLARTAMTFGLPKLYVVTPVGEQQRLAEESKARVAAKIGGEVHTAILPATEFTLAEDYHQKYYLRQFPGLWRELSRFYPDLTSLVNSTAAARMNGYVAGCGSVGQLEEELPGLGLSPYAGRQLLSRMAAKSGKAQGCPVPR